ncbi:MAG: hypothetical protein ACR2GL_02170 [Thermoleophilaceae bacterium]
MGQLDEAIRAHLELKRKHGASEEELHAEEKEALGPPRREAEGRPPAEEAHHAAESAPAQPTDLEEDYEAAYDDTVVEAAEEPGGGQATEAFDAFAEPPAESEVEDPLGLEEIVGEHEALDQEDALGREDREDQSHAAEYVEDDSDGHDGEFDPLEADPSDPRVGDTPPRGFQPLEDERPPAREELAPEEEEAEGEELLEETPDFLQETPEHDRLWFEQRPPRDFDFDDE